MNALSIIPLMTARIRRVEMAPVNHYDLAVHTLYVTYTMFKNTSEAKAIIAHECAHVEQNFTWWPDLQKALQIIAVVLLCYGVLFNAMPLLVLCILMPVLRWLANIGIELHASVYAYRWLHKNSTCNMRIVKHIYWQSLKTYIL